MAIQEAAVLPTDREIRLKLQERSTEDLLEFQRKLKLRGSEPQAVAIRFHLVRELLGRHLADTREG